METITIPSPTAFLSSPVLKANPLPPPPKRRSTTTNKSNRPPRKQNNVEKPKQSKSRNGCITCKAKRLKCDEIKPSCQQCHKRGVECGGYKKDFKWKPFEEATFVSKPAPTRKRNSIALEKPPLVEAASPAPSEDHIASPSGEDVQMQESFFDAAAPSPPTLPVVSSPDMVFNQSPIIDMSTPIYTRETPRPKSRIDPDIVTSSLSSMFDDRNSVLRPLSPPRPSYSGDSPKLDDNLMPGLEVDTRAESLAYSSMLLPTQALAMSPLLDPFSFLPTEMTQDIFLGDEIEEVVREPQLSDFEMWMSRQARRSSSSRSSSPSMSRDDPFNQIYRQPEMHAGSTEMLMLRFDKQTCGILSVKDGPTENPWRTLIWPLARNSPALYHAIASMTAFHTSKQAPALRVDGMEHMRSSIRNLASGIENMRTDTALATTLALAFAESWDQHISTGIEHLRGAKILVKQALFEHERRKISGYTYHGDDLARLKFLCNTWVYMDVIARLTSVDEQDAMDSDHDEVVWPFNSQLDQIACNTELDPLMGCAATLFPLIGRAANLCRKVGSTRTNSIAIINRATELKEAIERWSAPPSSAFDRPEDPTSEIQHALQTAEAYRFATLLYLHQAVPEIPSPTSAVLAKKVLVFLATVPLSSRLVIVQIYPLLAAGCEAWDAEDRQWVEERWHSMANRMWIGNIDRCQEVMQEVWNRRDADEQRKAEKLNQRRPGGTMMHAGSLKRKYGEELGLHDGFDFGDLLKGCETATLAKEQRNSFDQGRSSGSRRDSITEDIDPEMTVRGSLHWVGVMKDWKWESASKRVDVVLKFEVLRLRLPTGVGIDVEEQIMLVDEIGEEVFEEP